jgi:DNA-binding MarR family transcriptional regulator
MMARRRKSPSKIDLQAVLRFIAAAPDGVGCAPLVTWITATSGCRERAAKDNVSILAKGGWVAALPMPGDRRRKRHVITDKGRSDMRGHFGEGALRRGRRRYSTCLSGAARRRQAARVNGMNELEEALENETRRLFGGLTYAELTPPLGPEGKLPPLRVRPRKRPRFEARLRAELLGEGSAVPDDKSGFGPRLRAELLGQCSAVREDA